MKEEMLKVSLSKFDGNQKVGDSSKVKANKHKFLLDFHLNEIPILQLHIFEHLYLFKYSD